ncbi:methyltransferase [Caulobacter sp. Root655]|uniref:class I SAM-dependent methyltransferase n=1 Tax=Caulobacter sp. Root655 TaxID=1736578 RepID=UPI0006F4BE13|nr:class I SAM-dependent methyltransferase [Caulobacter sp. Root655]KRA59578.1 methyltransferase [Caulobacter sp. Root655]
MTSRPMLSILAAFAVGAFALPVYAQIPANITAALADPARPAADTARDAARHPGEILALAGVKPGAKALDFIIGGGYFTRILSPAVGPTGKVYAYQPAEFIAYKASYGEDLKAVAGAYKNVTPLNGSLGALDLPGDLDLVITVQNYHDLHLKSSPAGAAAAIDAAIFKALKPGGVFLIVDHAAADGSGTTASDSLHRIDIAAVKKEVEGAGFKLAAESPLLRNPADPRTLIVFDPAIRGKTDQFILKFVKP